jgi:hypothetical protein
MDRVRLAGRFRGVRYIYFRVLGTRPDRKLRTWCQAFMMVTRRIGLRITAVAILLIFIAWHVRVVYVDGVAISPSGQVSSADRVVYLFQLPFTRSGAEIPSWAAHAVWWTSGISLVAQLVCWRWLQRATMGERL